MSNRNTFYSPNIGTTDDKVLSLMIHIAPPAEHCYNSKNTTFQERGKTTGRRDAITSKERHFSPLAAILENRCVNAIPRGRYGLIKDIIERKRIQWYGHVKRMPDERIPKLIMEWIPEARRKRGRPRRTWMEGAATTARNLEKYQWRNREEWRLVSGRRRHLL
jgi:hypothetical protein